MVFQLGAVIMILAATAISLLFDLLLQLVPVHIHSPFALWCYNHPLSPFSLCTWQWYWHLNQAEGLPRADSCFLRQTLISIKTRHILHMARSLCELKYLHMSEILAVSHPAECCAPHLCWYLSYIWVIEWYSVIEGLIMTCSSHGSPMIKFQECCVC